MLYDVRNNHFVFKHSLDENPAYLNKKYKEHFHPEYELLYFIRGDASFYIEGEKYEIRPNFLIFVKPGEYHYVEVNSSKAYERIVIRFNKNYIKKSLKDKIDSLGRVYSIWNSPLEEEIKRLDPYYEHFSSNAMDVFTSALNIILNYLVKADNLKQISLYTNERLETVINYIHSNLVEIQTVDDIGRNVYMSRSILYELFSKEIGIPIMCFVRTQKCILAKNLMENGETPTEVYNKAGFKDYSSFYRAFLKTFNKKPSEAI